MKKILISLLFLQIPLLMWSNDSISIKDIVIQCQMISRNIHSTDSYALIDTLLQSMTDKNSKEEQLEVYLVKCRYHIVHQEDSLANESFKKYLTICQDMPDKRATLLSLNNLIDYSLNNGSNMPLVLSEIRAYQHIARSIGDDEAIMNAYFKKASCYFIWSNYSTALHYYNEAISYATEHQLKLNYSYYQNAAECARLADKNKISTEWQRKAIELYYQEPNEGDAPVYLLSGLLKNYIIDKKLLGDSIIDSTYSKLEQEKRKHEKLSGYSKNKYNEAMTTYYMDYKKDADKALKFLNSDNDLTTLLNKGRVYMATKEFKKGGEYYKRAYQKSNDLQQEQINYLLSQFIEREEYELLQKEIKTLEVQKSELEIELTNKENLFNKELSHWKVVLIASILSLLIIYIFIRLIGGYIKKRRKAARDKSKIDVDQLKSLFMQNMGYEIAAPLNAVVTFNELLNGKSEQNLSDSDKEAIIKLLKSNTELLQNMVNDITSMAQLENGTYKPILADFNVQHICRLVMDSAKNQAKPGVELLLDCNPEILILHTDAQRLQQLLYNLVLNACKHTTQGNIKLTYMKNATTVFFSVCNTGTGMNAEDADNIFNQFDKIDKGVVEGGLNLHVCKLIADLLNGKIYLDQNYKQGTRFIIEMPLF